MPASTAFEIPVDDIKGPKSPQALRRKIQAAQQSQSPAASRSELTNKLNVANDRQKQIQAEKSAKAASNVAHAQAIARSTKAAVQQKEEDAKAGIAAKLTHAEQARQAELAKKTNNIQSHLGDVKGRQAAASQELGTPGKDDINERLEAAAGRRDAAQKQMKEKLGEHWQKIEAAKSAPSPGKKELEAKLTAAERRRQAQEAEAKAKLDAREKHAAQVREKRKIRGGASMDDLAQAQSPNKIGRN